MKPSIERTEPADVEDSQPRAGRIVGVTIGPWRTCGTGVIAGLERPMEISIAEQVAWGLRAAVRA